MSKVIVNGKVEGTVLKTSNPINFLGAVDKKTGMIHDKKYDIFEKSIKGTENLWWGRLSLTKFILKFKIKLASLLDLLTIGV